MPPPGRHAAAVLALILGAALAGCESGGGDGRGGGTSTAAHGSRRDHGSTASTFDPGTRAWMEQALRRFSARDPAWEEDRARWLALGDREADFLVQTLFAGLLRAQAIQEPRLVEQARHELVRIGAPAVPLLASTLTLGSTTVENPETGELVTVPVDDLARREAAEVLALIGAPAAPATAQAARDAETKGGRRFALQALGNMGARGGQPAAATLLEWARSPDLVFRVEAVHGLRGFDDAATRDALLGALSDSEDLVREKAADALAARRDPATLPALGAAAARAREAGRLAEAARLDRAARAVRQGPR